MMREAIKDTELVDITTVNVEKNLPQLIRCSDFKKQIKDTGHYKCEGFTIQAVYARNGQKIEDCLSGMMA